VHGVSLGQEFLPGEPYHITSFCGGTLISREVAMLARHLLGLLKLHFRAQGQLA
jgi:hypothetical protein